MVEIPVRQISDVPIVIFEEFHPTSHTADLHPALSRDMGKLTEEVQSRTLLLYEECSNSILAKQYSITAILLQCIVDKFWYTCSGPVS
jgi:hypothetical protein